jgi:tetrahydromethanopterin S-methyltransferase subunit D
MTKGGKSAPAAPAAPVSMGNGGIMGSGIFGMFGTTIQCKAEDTSAFCTLSKIVNIIIMIGFILLILYLVYMVFKYFFGNRSQVGAQQMTGGYIYSNRTKRSKKPRYSNK